VGPRLLPGMPEAEAAALMMRLSLVSVAIWWAVFSIPIFRHVSEPAARGEAHEIGQNVVTVGFSRLGKALKDIRGYQDLFLFLITFLSMPMGSAQSLQWRLLMRLT